MLAWRMGSAALFSPVSSVLLPMLSVLRKNCVGLRSLHAYTRWRLVIACVPHAWKVG